MATLAVVLSSRFGELSLGERDRIGLLRPLAGFPATRALVRVVLPRQDPFVWLQSAEEPEVAFAAAPVARVRSGYATTLAPWDRELWGPEPAPEVMALLSFKNGATANLAAPILLDRPRAVCLQILNQSGAWGLTEPLARP